MKTANIVLLFSLLLLLSGHYLIAQPFDMQLDGARTNESLTLRLDHLDEQHTVLKIIDLSGKAWLKKHLWKEHNYAAKLNLRFLPEGDYLLTVKNRSGLKAVPFRMDAQVVMPFFLKHTREQDEGKKRLVQSRSSREGQLIARIQPVTEDPAILIQLANLREKPVSVKLISMEGITVFSDDQQGSNGYAARMNMENVALGHYFLYLRTGKTTLIQYLTMDENGIHFEEAYSREAARSEAIIIASR